MILKLEWLVNFRLRLKSLFCLLKNFCKTLDSEWSASLEMIIHIDKGVNFMLKVEMNYFLFCLNNSDFQFYDLNQQF